MEPGQVWGGGWLFSRPKEEFEGQESLTFKTGAFPFSDHLLIASSAERKTAHGLLYNPLTYQLPLVSFPYLSYSESKIQCLSQSHNDRKNPYDPLSFNNSLVKIAILDESNFLPSLTLHLVLGTGREKPPNQEDWYCPNSYKATSMRLSTLSGGSILVSSQYSVPISIEGNIFPLSSFNQVFLKKLSYWRIVDLQCCVSFWCIAKWFSYTYMASQVVLVVKNLPANAGDVRDKDSIPVWGRSPREGHGSPLQYSCLEHPMDKGAWHATVHRVAKSWTWLKWLNTTIPNSQSILLLSWKPQVCLLCLWIYFCFIDKFSVSYFRFHM